MSKRSIHSAALVLALAATTAAASAQTMSAGGTPKPIGSPMASPMPGASSMPMTGMKKKAKPMASSSPSSTARHGAPIDATGANSGSSSNPTTGTNIPSTTGASK